MRAIVYTTNAGSTEQYAKLLAQETGLPVYSLAEAKRTLSSSTEIVYLGWIMAVCAVGMGQTGTQVDVVRKKNAIPQQIPLFTLQGNFDIEKLHGMYRFMMQMMVKFAGKGLSNKQNRTPEEDDMLDMMLHGGNRVCIENLQAVLDWYKNC